MAGDRHQPTRAAISEEAVEEEVRRRSVSRAKKDAREHNQERAQCLDRQGKFKRSLIDRQATALCAAQCIGDMGEELSYEITHRSTSPDALSQGGFVRVAQRDVEHYI